MQHQFIWCSDVNSPDLPSGCTLNVTFGGARLGYCACHTQMISPCSSEQFNINPGVMWLASGRASRRLLKMLRLRSRHAFQNGRQWLRGLGSLTVPQGSAPAGILDTIHTAYAHFTADHHYICVFSCAAVFIMNVNRADVIIVCCNRDIKYPQWFVLLYRIFILEVWQTMKKIKNLGTGRLYVHY
jgi:hypothetical protein